MRALSPPPPLLLLLLLLAGGALEATRYPSAYGGALNSSPIRLEAEVEAEAEAGEGEDDDARPRAGAPVRDLAVATRGEAPRMQLLVSWTPPEGTESEAGEGFQAPRGYAVTVNLLNATAAACAAHSATFATEHVLDPSVSSVLVPPEVRAGVDALLVRPGCTYNASVESDPYYGGPVPHAVYTVPVCADACLCRPPLPKPLDLREEALPSGGRDVYWRLPSPARDVQLVYVELGEQSFVSNAALGVYNKRWNATVPVAGAGRKAGAVVPAAVLRPGRKYQVRAQAVDALGCRGPASSLFFELPPVKAVQNAADDSKGTWQAVLLVLVPAVVVGGVALCLCGRCAGADACVPPWKRARTTPDQAAGGDGVYKVHNDSHALLTFPSHQERNIIYVEKEIEEAQARGDADAFEVSYERLVMGRQVGKGAFGRVFLAEAEAVAGTPGWQRVAVKKLKQRATAEEVEEFLAEIAMLKKVGHHPNVVTMLGCCTLRQPYCMLMEYVPCGDLLQYLRRLRAAHESRAPPPRSPGPANGPAPSNGPATAPRGPRYIELLLPTDSEGSYVQPESLLSSTSGRPSIPETEWSLLSSEGEPQTPTKEKNLQLDCVLDPAELQSFAIQIAQGMAHLEMKQITHRDLAARNVLIDQKKTLKISDFGLSRTGIYVNTKRKKVPLRWLSIEAMRDNLYSSKSDVWAFAIVLWEIGTLGGFPYPTVADMNLLSFLMDGKRLEKPDNCSDELYSLMIKCWSYSPDARPSFAELVQHLDSVMSHRHVYVDFSNLSPDYSFPPTEQQTAERLRINGNPSQVLLLKKS